MEQAVLKQAEVDVVVVRVKRLVERYGGTSPRLASVRSLYKLFHDCPEPGVFGLLSAALDEAEELEGDT